MTMTRCLFTRTFLESLQHITPPSKYTHYRDEEIPGFILEYRHTRKGTWYFRYRDAQNTLRLWRLGTLAAMPLAEARVRAYTVQQLIEGGGDPYKDWTTGVDTLKLEDFVAKHYLPHAQIKKRSWELDQRILRLHILPRFGHCKMDKVRRTDILSWQKELREKGLAPATCNRAFVLLKTVFNCAIQWGMLKADKNPCRGVSPFEDKCLRERYLSPEEARRLLLALDACTNHQGAQALQLLLFTGARTQEILTARWEHVDFERRLLTVPLSKSGKTRYIPLSDDAVRVLHDIPHGPHGESPWIFPQKSGNGPMRSVFYLWRQLRVQLGLEDVRVHDLRHSFASFLVNAGCSLYEVQRCLGHSDPKVTMRYAHFASHALVNAANMVGKTVRAGAY